MCGIAGEISFSDTLDVSQAKKLLAALRHRGPDGMGINKSKQVSLAMRRLAIIDVKGGDQPLYNEDKSIEIVGNGEIYNYVELQKDLKKKGHKLRTGSDIETVVHLYEDLDIECVKKLRGMFALALYDKKQNKVILMRDRLGEKPLYYTQTKHGLVFASEMKALLQVKGLDKTLNTQAIHDYFHYYYIPEPNTMFSAIKKLAPGKILIIDVTTQSIIEHTYWDGSDIKPTHTGNPTKKIRDEFARACELTLRSDVPVGIALSGGIDSGAILAFSAPKYKDTMKAFSVGYEGQSETDERELARKLAKQFKVEFIETEIKTQDMIDHFPTLVWQGDDPIADIAGYSIYRVSRLSRQHKVPVMLGGLGGDELFWGYPSTVEAVKRNLHRPFWKKFTTPDFMYNNPNPKTTGSFIEKLYHYNFKHEVIADTFSSHSEVAVAKHQLDMLRDKWLVSNCIALNDRLSMASSIELRSPFLDYKLVETVLSSIPAVTAYKLPHKYWFKKAMTGILPDEVLNRPKKGFTPPVSAWLKGIISTYGHLLKNGFLIDNQIVDERKIRLLLKTWMGLPMHWYSIYQLILLETWGREFVYAEKDLVRSN